MVFRRSVGQFEFISTIYSMAAKLKQYIYESMSVRSKCVLDLPLPVMRFHLKSWEKKEAMKNFDAAAAHKQAIHDARVDLSEVRQHICSTL